MQVAVWDTYVTKKDGSIMHFDIIAPDHIKNEGIIHVLVRITYCQKIRQISP